MRTFTIAFVGGIVGTIFATFIVLAWTGPTAPPPNGNVAAPINTGKTDQVKDAGLALNALAVFGNSILSGPSVTYLNFGGIAQETGYGIRDNAGTMQFKNSSGNWSNFLPSTGVQSITFADGTTQTTAANGGGITAETTDSCTTRATNGPTTCTTPSCPTGYFRSGCSGIGSASGIAVTQIYPTGSACACRKESGIGGTATCYIHCLK
jgi:hypothetical protein